MDNMNRNNLESSLRLAVSIAVIVAVVISGFSLIIIGFAKSGVEKEQTAYCQVFFPIEDGSMNKSEPFNDDRSFFLTVPAIINISNIDNIKPILKYQKFSQVRKINVGRYIRLSTTASISSKKAMEFTLIGAKPSGTG